MTRRHKHLDHMFYRIKFRNWWFDPNWIREVRVRSREGMRFRRYHGYAYYSFDKDCSIWIIFPFNIVIALLRWTEKFLRYDLPTRIGAKSNLYKRMFLLGYDLDDDVRYDEALRIFRDKCKELGI